MSIALNSYSKYKTRVLPSVLEYINRKNKLPRKLIFALAALIAFYKGKRGEELIKLQDESAVLDHFAEAWGHYSGSEAELRAIVTKTLSNTDLWDRDLTVIEGLTEAVWMALCCIEKHGMLGAVKQVLS
jgi:tagaturonate reductase